MLLRLALLSLACLIAEIRAGKVREEVDLRLLSRAKRYVVFPEGSTWSIAICSMTQAIVPANGGIWTEAINWGISYDLPNETSTFRYFLFPFQATPEEGQRRIRRDLYGQMETIIDSVGFDGRGCLLRALCEAAQRYSNLETSSVMEEILKRIFTFSLENLRRREPEEHRHYHRAYRIGMNNNLEEDNCADVYPCPISIIKLATSDFFSALHVP